MSTIIEFPVARTKRALNLRRQESRRIFALSALFSVLMIGVFMQLKVEDVSRASAIALKSERSGDSMRPQRAIASASTSDLTQELTWENEIAGKLKSIEPRVPASIGSECTGAVCVMGSSYRIVYGDGVLGAAFAEGLSDDGVRGLPTRDVPRILKGMRGIASIPYDSFSLVTDDSLILPDGAYSAWRLQHEGSAQGYAVIREKGEQIGSLVFCSADVASLSDCMKQVE